MTRKILFILTMSLLVACSTIAQSAPSASPTATNALIQTTLVPATATEVGAATAKPTATGSAQAIPSVSATPRPTLVPNAWMTGPAVPTTLSARSREIYARGLELGRDPTHFSKIGDCQNVTSYFLGHFDNPDEYTLGDKYAYLQPTIDYYRGSFGRDSLATKGGFNVAAILSPLRADPKSCKVNESPVDCELRVWNPSVAIVSLEEGWNARSAEKYSTYMRQILDKLIANGTLPIIATKADNVEGDNSINAAVVQLAYEYDIPLWNFYAAAHVLPDQGLSPDGFHLTFAQSHFDNETSMMNAWPWRNLTALQTLDFVRTNLIKSQP